MKHRSMIQAGITAATALVVTASFTAITQAEPAVGVTPTLLSRGTLDAFNVRSDPHGTIAGFRAHSIEPIDMIVRQHDYAVSGTTGWHSHPGPVFITVTQGTLTFYEYDEPCTPHVVTAGQAFVDNGRGHMVRNESGAAARDMSVIVAPVAGAFRTNLVPPQVTC